MLAFTRLIVVISVVVGFLAWCGCNFFVSACQLLINPVDFDSHYFRTKKVFLTLSLEAASSAIPDRMALSPRSQSYPVTVG